MPQFVGYSGMAEGRTDYEAFYGVAPRMLYWGSHCHDFYEFYIHFHGGHQYACDGRFFDLSPCQLFIIPPFSMHGLVCRTEALDYERAFLYCTTETLERAGCGQIDLDDAFRSAVRAKGNMYMMPEEDAGFCRTCLSAITEKQDVHSPEAAFENYGLILTFLSCVLKTVRNQCEDPAKHLTTPAPMQQIIGYINTHYTEPIRLSELSARFNISKSALSHEFARYTNRGVYEYILYRRVILAQQLILSGKPLGDIAQQCGFCDYSNFLRVFHKHAGMSPRQYRDARLSAPKGEAAP